MPPKCEFNNPFSQAQTKLIVIAFRHMKSTPDIDFDAVAKEYGYGSANIARAKFCAARSACKNAGPSDNAGTDGSCNGTPTKKRKTVEPDGTPSKRGRKPTKKKMEEEEQGSGASGGGSEKDAKEEPNEEPFSSPYVKDDPENYSFEKDVCWV